MNGQPERAALVAAARDSIARGSKSFAAASRLFTPSMRERAWLLYAWCRAADDLADGQELGRGAIGVANPAARLMEIRTLTESALAGSPTSRPAFDGLAVVVRECALPAGLVRDLVEGFALDADAFSPQDEGDLARYCYHVAGSVGVMMARLMGVAATDTATLDRACDLGLAFQYANIARDVAEDARGGRCYLPADWLWQAGLTQGDLLRPDRAGDVALLTARLADRAAAYARSARAGMRALPFRAAWAVLAAAGIYGDIAQVVRADGVAALERRVVISRRRKAGWLLRALGQTIARRWRFPDRPRDGLWTRPNDMAGSIAV